MNALRYAQCWEDADVLVSALAIRPGGTYVAIASAGDNALAMLAAGPERVIAIDREPAQLAALALRVAGVPHARPRRVARADRLASARRPARALRALPNGARRRRAGVLGTRDQAPSARESAAPAASRATCRCSAPSCCR